MSSLRILPLVLALILIGAGATKADDRDDVLAANKAFGAAFSTRKIESIDPRWAHDDSVTIIHPRSKTVLVGWDAVRRSWVEGFSREIEASVTMDNPAVSVTNNVGWSWELRRCMATFRTVKSLILRS